MDSPINGTPRLSIAPKRKVHDLLSWRKQGLVGEAAQVLLFVVLFCRNERRAATLKEIIFGAGVETDSCITVAAALKRHGWYAEGTPYLGGGRNSYLPNRDVFITEPHIAELLLAIHNSPSPVSEIQFSSWSVTACQWPNNDPNPDESLQFLLNRQYIQRHGGSIVTTSFDNGRFCKERQYLELLGQHSSLSAVLAGSPTLKQGHGRGSGTAGDRTPSCILGVDLTKEEADLLVVLWDAFYLLQQPDLTASDIGKLLPQASHASIASRLKGLGPDGRNMIKVKKGDDPRYALKFNVPSYPPTAQMLCHLIINHLEPLPRQQYIEWLSRNLLRQKPELIEKYVIGFSEECGYIENITTGTHAGGVKPSERAVEQAEFYRQVEKRFQRWLNRPHSDFSRLWKQSRAEWELQLSKEELWKDISYPAWSPEVVEVFYQLVWEEHFGASEYLSVETIKKRIATGQRLPDGARICDRVEDAIAFLSTYRGGMLDEHNGTYRRRLLVSLSWPCCAYIIVNLMKFGRYCSYDELKKQIATEHYRTGELASSTSAHDFPHHIDLNIEFLVRQQYLEALDRHQDAIRYMDTDKFPIEQVVFLSVESRAAVVERECLKRIAVLFQQKAHNKRSQRKKALKLKPQKY